MAITKQWSGSGVADGTTLTTSTVGTGDNVFNVVSGTSLVQVTNGLAEVEIPSVTSVRLFGWNALNLSAWQLQFYFRLTSASATSSGVPILELRHATGQLMKLTLGTNDTVSLLNSTNGFVSASPAIVKGTGRYRITVWGQAGTDSINLRMYSPDGSLVWSRSSQAIGNSSNLNESIFGRNSTVAYGPAYFSQMKVGNVAAELTAESTTTPPAYPIRWSGAGVATGTTLTTSTVGTGDKAFDAVTNASTVRITNGETEIEIPSVDAVRTFKWSGLNLSAWQAQFYFRHTPASPISSGVPIFEAHHATGLLFKLTLGTNDSLSLLSSTGTWLSSSPILTKGAGRYRISMWAQAGTDSIHIRMYSPTGELIWTRDQAVGNASNLNEVVFGRNGIVAYGPAYFSYMTVGNVAAELPGEGSAPATATYPKTWNGLSVGDGTTLTTTTGSTGDAVFDAVAGTLAVRINGGVREIEVDNVAAARTFRWSSLNLATWQFRFYFRFTPNSATSSGTSILEARHAAGLFFRLTLGTNDTLSMLSSTGAFLAASPVMTKGTGRYRISAWAKAGTDIVHLRVYNPDGTTFWSRDQAVGTANNLDEVIFGRNGTVAYGPAYFSNLALGEAYAEMLPYVNSSIFGYVLESNLTTLTPVSLVGMLAADLTTIIPLQNPFQEITEEPPEPPRVYARHPFASNSIWNIPIHSGVKYTTSSDTRTSMMASLSGTMNYGPDWNLAIWQAKSTSPLVEIKAPRSTYPTWPTTGARHRVPADGVVPGPDGDGTYNVEYDGWVTIISPDGSSAIDLYKAKWITVGVTLQAAYAYQYPLNLDGGTDSTVGTPAGNGLKASNWPYMGGIIRKWEMASTAPPAERIRHAITISIPNSALKSGYVWPSRGQDANGTTAYYGTIPMGTCFALPPSFNIETASLTEHGKALAYSLQNYGAWIGDRSGNASIYTEMNTGSALGDPYKVAWNALRPKLVAVDGRTATYPGGTGTPRVPFTGEGVNGPI